MRSRSWVSESQTSSAWVRCFRNALQTGLSVPKAKRSIQLLNINRAASGVKKSRRRSLIKRFPRRLADTSQNWKTDTQPFLLDFEQNWVILEMLLNSLPA